MSSIIQKVQNAFTSSSHTVPPITHRQKILIALTSAAPQLHDHRSGYFWGELLHPYEEFVKAGYDVDLVSVNGSATVDEFSIGQMAMSGDTKKWQDKDFTLHQKLAQLRSAGAIPSASMYCAMFFAGGHGCVQDFPNASALQSLAAQIYEAGGVIGAVCHGVAIFQNLKLSNGRNIIDGKEVTGFSTKAEEAGKYLDWLRMGKYHTMQEIVTMSGGRWTEHESDPMKEYVRTSDRVVTGMNPASAKAVADAMITFLPKDQDIEPKQVDGTRIGSSSVDKGKASSSSSTITNPNTAQATAGTAAATGQPILTTADKNAVLEDRTKERNYVGEERRI